MAEFSCTRQGSIDIITISGILGDDVVVQLKSTISTLRQQGSVKILLIGKSIERISTKNLNDLARSIRIYRNMGGKVALAEDRKAIVKVFERLTWYRFLNVFDTVEEAIHFLDPAI